MNEKYKITLAYDGTHYSGWQIQPNSPTIQEELHKSLKLLLREKIIVIGAGRTDSGVHAKAQVAHFSYSKDIDTLQLMKSLNGILPRDVRILKVEHICKTFHARYSAKRKIYHYFLNLNPFQDPFRRLYSHHVRHKLDIDAMKTAAKYFIGTHDFTSFANEAHSGSAGRNPLRTLYRLDLVEENNGYIRLEFEGESFLYKMVRNIVGTLLDVGSKKISANDITAIFQAKDRRCAGRASPALGLFLISIDYPT